MPSIRKQLNVRLSDKTFESLEKLADALDCSQADVVTRALKLLATRERDLLKSIEKKSDNPLDNV